MKYKRSPSDLATQPVVPYHPPPDIPLHILYADEHLLVVDKPEGLLSVPGRGEDKKDCLIHRLQRQYTDALVVHRLDMATSGLMLFALNKSMQAALSQIFAQRKIDKRYMAIVYGQLSESEGTVDLPLILDWPNRPRQKVDLEQGKSAQTHYQVLDYDSAVDVSRVQLTPYTGRSHQLRVHMQQLGHAIVGDDLYAPAALAAQSKRLMLHAEALAFDHPLTSERLDLLSAASF